MSEARTLNLLSIVVPVFNEEEVLPIFIEELKRELSALSSSKEILLIDDGSSDGTWALIKQLAKKYESVKGISLSRNFGHQSALKAGLDHAKGEAVISMDGDLQHPPALISLMVEKYSEGFDVVSTLRASTAGVSQFKKRSSKIYYMLINYFSDLNLKPGSADFRLMSRKAVGGFQELKEKDRFTRGLVSWVGYSTYEIEYQSPKRAAGESKYTFGKMIRFALTGITSFSSKPLRVSFIIGLIISSLGVLYSLYAIYQKIIGNSVEGWTSLLISVLLIGGIQLISIGILGEYIARIFYEVKDRPVYLIKDETL